MQGLAGQGRNAPAGRTIGKPVPSLWTPAHVRALFLFIHGAGRRFDVMSPVLMMGVRTFAFFGLERRALDETCSLGGQ